MTEFIEELSEEIAPPTKLVIARERLTRWLARAERDYLVILRVAFLILASLLLLGATWLLGSGIFKQFGSTTVVADPVAITARQKRPPRLPKALQPTR